MYKALRDITLFLKVVVLFFIGFIIGMSIVFANDEPTGNSKICDDIGYLSTSCKNVKVLPFEYKDKDVAKEKAKQPITKNNTLNIDKIINQYDSKTNKDDSIIIKTWFENE